MECHNLSWAPGLKRWDLLIPLHCRCKPGLQRERVCTWISSRNIHKKRIAIGINILHVQCLLIRMQELQKNFALSRGPEYLGGKH